MEEPDSRKLMPDARASTAFGQGMSGVVRPRAKFVASNADPRQVSVVGAKTNSRDDLAARIYRRLAGARGLDDAERWQHALFFAMSPQERCHFSLKTARSALSLRRSGKKR